MLYFTVAFLVFALFVFARNPRHPTSYFLLGSIAGWCLSFYGFLRYLANLNFSYLLVRYFFYVPGGLWNSFVSSHSLIIDSLRIMNVGLACFIVATYLYVTNVFGSSRFRVSRILPILPVLLQPLVYDPVFYRAVDSAFPWAEGLYQSLHSATRVYNLTLLAFPAALLVWQLVVHRRIPVVRYFYLFNTIGLIVVILAFLFTFSWAPTLLTRLYSGTSYLVFDTPTFVPNQVFYAAYPYLSVLSFTILLFALLRYKSIDRILATKNSRYSRMYGHDGFGLRAMSHALKNQLLAIKFESEELAAGLPPDGALGRCAQTILSLSSEALDSLDGMYRKIQRRHLVFELVSMNDFLLDYVGRRRTWLPRSIEMSCRPTKATVEALVDRALLEECFNVVVQNSIDALGAEGRGRIEITTELSGLWFVVSFRDDGPGIPAEILRHVGEPFFTTKSSRSNWGLGLSFVKRILRSHLGYLKFAREAPQGATVRFFLPMVL